MFHKFLEKISFLQNICKIPLIFAKFKKISRKVQILLAVRKNTIQSKAYQIFSKNIQFAYFLLTWVEFCENFAKLLRNFREKSNFSKNCWRRFRENFKYFLSLEKTLFSQKQIKNQQKCSICWFSAEISGISRIFAKVLRNFCENKKIRKSFAKISRQLQILIFVRKYTVWSKTHSIMIKNAEFADFLLK